MTDRPAALVDGRRWMRIAEAAMLLGCLATWWLDRAVSPYVPGDGAGSEACRSLVPPCDPIESIRRYGDYYGWIAAAVGFTVVATAAAVVLRLRRGPADARWLRRPAGTGLAVVLVLVAPVVALLGWMGGSLVNDPGPGGISAGIACVLVWLAGVCVAPVERRR